MSNQSTHHTGWILRPATLLDLNFLVWIDTKDEGVSSSYMANWDDADWARHREQIRAYITDADKLAIVATEAGSEKRIGAIYASFLQADDLLKAWAFLPEARAHFPADGRFCNIFQLWVDPEWRRKGLGTALKQALEPASTERGVGAIFTKTESANPHVVELNRRLGYQKIYIGPMWDAIERVALLKML